METTINTYYIKHVICDNKCSYFILMRCPLLLVYLQFWIFENYIIKHKYCNGLIICNYNICPMIISLYGTMSRNKTACFHIIQLPLPSILNWQDYRSGYFLTFDHPNIKKRRKFTYIVLYQCPKCMFFFFLLSCVNIGQYRYITVLV
jgi:hypothetical protein